MIEYKARQELSAELEELDIFHWLYWPLLRQPTPKVLESLSLRMKAASLPAAESAVAVSAGKEASGKEAAGKEASGKEASGKKTAGNGKSHRQDIALQDLAGEAAAQDKRSSLEEEEPQKEERYERPEQEGWYERPEQEGWYERPEQEGREARDERLQDEGLRARDQLQDKKATAEKREDQPPADRDGRSGLEAVSAGKAEVTEAALLKEIEEKLIRIEDRICRFERQIDNASLYKAAEERDDLDEAARSKQEEAAEQGNSLSLSEEALPEEKLPEENLEILKRLYASLELNEESFMPLLQYISKAGGTEHFALLLFTPKGGRYLPLFRMGALAAEDLPDQASLCFTEEHLRAGGDWDLKKLVKDPAFRREIGESLLGRFLYARSIEARQRQERVALLLFYRSAAQSSSINADLQEEISLLLRGGLPAMLLFQRSLDPLENSDPLDSGRISESEQAESPEKAAVEQEEFAENAADRIVQDDPDGAILREKPIGEAAVEQAIQADAKLSGEPTGEAAVVAERIGFGSATALPAAPKDRSIEPLLLSQAEPIELSPLPDLADSSPSGSLRGEGAVWELRTGSLRKEPSPRAAPRRMEQRRMEQNEALPSGASLELPGKLYTISSAPSSAESSQGEGAGKRALALPAPRSSPLLPSPPPQSHTPPKIEAASRADSQLALPPLSRAEPVDLQQGIPRPASTGSSFSTDKGFRTDKSFRNRESQRAPSKSSKGAAHRQLWQQEGSFPLSVRGLGILKDIYTNGSLGRRAFVPMMNYIKELASTDSCALLLFDPEKRSCRPLLEMGVGSNLSEALYFGEADPFLQARRRNLEDLARPPRRGVRLDQGWLQRFSHIEILKGSQGQESVYLLLFRPKGEQQPLTIKRRQELAGLLREATPALLRLRSSLWGEEHAGSSFLQEAIRALRQIAAAGGSAKVMHIYLKDIGAKGAGASAAATEESWLQRLGQVREHISKGVELPEQVILRSPWHIIAIVRGQGAAFPREDSAAFLRKLRVQARVAALRYPDHGRNSYSYLLPYG